MKIELSTIDVKDKVVVITMENKGSVPREQIAKMRKLMMERCGATELIFLSGGKVHAECGEVIASMTVEQFLEAFDPKPEMKERPAPLAPATTTADKIQVCDNCFHASCWQAEFMCTDSADAGTVWKTRAELRQMKDSGQTAENESYWKTDAELSGGG